LKDLTVNLKNVTGTAASVAETLGEAGINIEGMASISAGKTAEMHVLVADSQAARQALKDAGIECGADREVDVLPIVDAPGELGRYLRRIADAGVNVKFMYLATNTRLVIAADDQWALRRVVLT
jgi:hypothetical protein